MCLLKLFGGINPRLTMVLQLGILIQKYHYVEKDPRAKQASMWHVMMLQQRYPHLLPTWPYMVISIPYQAMSP
jgi:hypothetical protein